MHERAVQDNTLNQQRIEQLDSKNKEQLGLTMELLEKNTQMDMELRKRGEEVQRLKQEMVRGNKVRDGLQKRLKAAEEQKAELEGTRESLKQQISSLERGETRITNGV